MSGWGQSKNLSDEDTSLVKHTTTLVCDEHNQIISWKENYVLGPTEPTIIRSSYQNWFTHIAPTSTSYNQITPIAINLQFGNNERHLLESVSILTKNPYTHKESVQTYKTNIKEYARDSPRHPYPKEALKIDLKTGHYIDEPIYKSQEKPNLPDGVLPLSNKKNGLRLSKKRKSP